MFDSPQVILVEGDPELRKPDAYLQLLFGKKAIASPPVQAVVLQPKAPNWVLYEDKFSGVYTVTEAYVAGGVSQGQSPAILGYKAYRPPDEEWPYQQSNHALLNQFRWNAIGLMLPYTFEVPDFNDDPWLEWVHPGIQHAALFQSFRIPAIPSAKYQPSLVFWRPRFWDQEAEPDITRLSPHSLLIATFGHKTPIVPVVIQYLMDSMWRADQQGPAKGQGNVGITADTMFYSADGADLINGGAVGIQSGLTYPPPPPPEGNPQPTIQGILRY